MKKIKLSLKQKNILRKVIFIISFAVFLVSSIILIRRAVDSYRAKTLNNELSKIHEEMNTIEPTNSNDTQDDFYYLDNEYKIETLKRANEVIAERERFDEENKANQIKNQILKIKKINGDIKGWIRIDNTQLSNPVVQTSDNSFYLEHDVSKKENSYGTIFIDARNDISNPKKLQGQNIILYGHHMKDGTMFGSLKKFRDDDFFKANDIIKLDIFPNNYKFQIFGVYLVDQDFDYRNTKLGTKENIKSLLNRLAKKCIEYRDITINPKDTILTLSTCDYDFVNARLVAMAKLVTDDDIKGTDQK